jgi:hypothetical protein
MCQEKSTYLITPLQGWVTDVLHGILNGVTCEETLHAGYRSQLNLMTQKV